MGAARERRNLQDQITVTTAVTDNKRRGQQTSKVSFNARSSSSSSSSSSWLLYASVAVILGGYAIYPSKSNPLHSAIFLSYPLPSTKSASGPPTQYGKGPKDCIFVAFYTLVLFAVRDFIQERLGRPLAKSWGIVDAAKQEKFVQQLYQAIYFGAISIFGLFVMKRTALWYFHMPGLFDGFPHKTHDAPFKVFYLVQSANWVQQAAATMLGLEKARKDYVVLVAHHIVTLAIIPLVYITHMTHFALALVIPQDITDSFLCFGKCISYADVNSTISTPYFAFFVGSWIYFRHYVGGITFWTLLTRYKSAITRAYAWENQPWKATSLHGVVVGLFGALQLMNIYWLYLIMRIAVKVASGETPQDERETEEKED